jgi:hypothetical protein
MYISNNKNGVRQIDEPRAIPGSLGPIIPLLLESRIEENNRAVNWVMNDRSNTRPSILRTVFQGEDGCQSAKPAGVGLSGIPVPCIYEDTIKGLSMICKQTERVEVPLSSPITRH